MTRHWWKVLTGRTLEPAAVPENQTAEMMVSRGYRANALLNDQLVKEAMWEVIMEAHRKFELAKTDADLRAARDLLESGNVFLRHLRGIANVGNAELKKLQALEQKQGRERDAMLVGLSRRR